MTNKISNLSRYEEDLERLIDRGGELENSIQLKCYPKEMREAAESELGKEAESYLKKIPDFDKEYQAWYSEAKVLVKQLLPDRFSDFVGHYEKPKSRKEITYESYRIVDALQGLNVTRVGFGREKVVGVDAAIPHVRQQRAILASARERFRSSLFDIKQLVQADLFDSEIEVAEELAKKKFLRAAGGISGVIIERHLSQVCDNHNGVRIAKKNPGIADFNDALKSAGVIDTPQWRSIQFLADIRNLCDHDKKKEPTSEQINDLVVGTKKLIKSLF